MSFKLVLILDDKRINVLSYRLSFNQGADGSGRPSQIPIFNGIELVIETQKDVNLADWAFSPNQMKQFELHFEPVIEGSRIRKLRISDGCLVNWQNNFSSIGNQPMSERLFITAAGVEDSFSNAVYSAKWRKTYPKKEIEPTTLLREEPNLVNYYLKMKTVTK